LRALVTGGAGFIGSHIVDALLARKAEVVVLDNLDARVHGEQPRPDSPDGVEFVHGDVRDKSVWESVLRGVDYVFHQAAYQDYMSDYSKFFHTNVVGTALMYEVIRESKFPVQKIVVASSQAVYGEGQYDCLLHGMALPAARSHEQMSRGEWEVVCPVCAAPMKHRLLQEPHVNPYNQYAVSKYSQELTALRLGLANQVPTTALRYSITQGPRQSPHNTYSGICRIFTQRLLSGDPPLVYEDGRQLRDYIHIDDVVAANLHVVFDSRSNFEAFNVGSGQGTSVLEYACSLASILNSPVRPVIPRKFRVGDNRNSVSDISKLKALGWSPVHTLQTIMEDYVRWLRESGKAGLAYREADSRMEAMGVVCGVY
jgi:dTDP-L-rhamnose 4-epimerase